VEDLSFQKFPGPLTNTGGDVSSTKLNCHWKVLPAFSIFCENYSGYPAWVFFHNGTAVNEIQLAENGGQ